MSLPASEESNEKDNYDPASQSEKVMFPCISGMQNSESDGSVGEPGRKVCHQGRLEEWTFRLEGWRQEAREWEERMNIVPGGEDIIYSICKNMAGANI